MEPRERASEQSLEELAALLETAGGVSLGYVLQNRPSPDPHSFIGEGKADEVRQLATANDCSLIVFDNELSPSQMRALEERIGLRVLDRSGLILDIFAGRARTREGRLQVELAQYKYLLPRLIGMWTHLGRQTASGASRIGTRGPGETQLETDRRHIRRKIAKLEADLAEVRRVRRTQRRAREKNAMPVVALVGYTNAGKSTLMGALTGAGIQTGDRLFDTLDPTTRRFSPDGLTQALLSDTVGFIRKLPHQLVEAFRATLEELCQADLLLHVIDASSPDWREQAEVVDRLILSLGAAQTPCIRVMNKCDRAPDALLEGSDGLRISAKTGEGLEALRQAIAAQLGRGRRRGVFLLPYARGALLEALHSEANVLRTEYTDEGVRVDAICPDDLFTHLSPYLAQAR